MSPYFYLSEKLVMNSGQASKKLMMSKSRLKLLRVRFANLMKNFKLFARKSNSIKKLLTEKLTLTRILKHQHLMHQNIAKSKSQNLETSTPTKSLNLILNFMKLLKTTWRSNSPHQLRRKISLI